MFLVKGVQPISQTNRRGVGEGESSAIGVGGVAVVGGIAFMAHK